MSRLTPEDLATVEARLAFLKAEFFLMEFPITTSYSPDQAVRLIRLTKTEVRQLIHYYKQVLAADHEERRLG